MIVKNNKYINQRVLDYNNGDEFAMNDVYAELEKYIKVESSKAVERAKDYKMVIPQEDFESAYNLALWEAVKGYDGSTNFIQRFKTFINRKEADVWRSYKTVINGETTYQKARNAYLDNPINEDGDTLGDIVLSNEATEGMEDTITEVSHIKNAIQSYSTVHKRYARVIKMLSEGATNQELADAFGKGKYNSTVRNIVRRARNGFEQHMNSITV